MEESRIISIEELDEEIEVVDIEVDGNRLFYANDILTHNSGYDNSDVELTDTSESFGLPATVDLMLALIATDDLKQVGQMMFKQLKNRFSDPEKNKKFIVGVDKSRMRLYNLEKIVQDTIANESSIQEQPKSSFQAKFDKKSFKDFK